MSTLHLRKFLALALGMLLAAGCGPEDAKVVGIDGTGTRDFRDVVSVGRVRSLGNIDVNGVRYDTAAAIVRDGGDAGSAAQLAVGDVVLLHGRYDPGSSAGTARSIESLYLVQGVVDSLDLARSELQVLGQHVVTSDATTYGETVAGGVSALREGDAIRVAGFRNLLGQVLATRIERQTTVPVRFGAIGAITQVMEDGRHFAINGLVVDRAQAAGLSSGFARGLHVNVEGERLGSGVLAASYVISMPRRISGDASHAAHVEGYVTSVDNVNRRGFSVGGLGVVTSESTQIDGTLNTGTLVQVRGEVNSGGAIDAARIIAGQGPGPVGNRDISGLVFDASSGPVAGASVDLYVTLPNGSGYSYTWATGGQLLTDPAGRFNATVPESSRVLVYVSRVGFVQPCGLLVDVASAPSFDVELVSDATLDSFDAPLPQRVSGNTFTGTVFERTDEGTLPVAGATVWFGDGFGFTYALTRTDRNGRYFACNMPRAPEWVWSTEIWAYKDGYESRYFAPEITDPATETSIELRREP